MKEITKFVGTVDEFDIEGEETLVPQCTVCVFLINEEKRTCEKFPKGIPDKFFLGDEAHDEFEPNIEI